MEHRIGELRAQALHAHAAQHEVEAAGRRVVAADSGPRLDRRDDQPVVDELDLDDMRGRCHRRVDRRLVAALETVGEVAGRFVPQQRRAKLQRGRRIDHRGQDPVIDRDQLGGVAGDIPGLGDDERHRIADMTHAAARQCMARRHDDRSDRRDLGDAGQRADALGGKIGGGEDAMHTWQRSRRGRIEPGNLGVAVRRAQHDRMQLARRVNVLRAISVPGRAGNARLPSGAPSARYADHLSPSLDLSVLSNALRRLNLSPAWKPSSAQRAAGLDPAARLA